MEVPTRVIHELVLDLGNPRLEVCLSLQSEFPREEDVVYTKSGMSLKGIISQNRIPTFRTNPADGFLEVLCYMFSLIR